MDYPQEAAPTVDDFFEAEHMEQNKDAFTILWKIDNSELPMEITIQKIRVSWQSEMNWIHIRGTSIDKMY